MNTDSTAFNSLDAKRKFALIELNVTAATFGMTATFGSIETARKIGINDAGCSGCGDCRGFADGTDSSNGTQDANSPDGDGFSRFTECNGESVRGDLRDRHREVDGECTLPFWVCCDLRDRSARFSTWKS